MLRQRWVVGNQGIVEIVGLFVGGDEAVEFLEPVEDDVDTRGNRVRLWPDHNEALAIPGDIVVGQEAAAVLPVEQRCRDPGSPHRNQGVS